MGLKNIISALLPREYREQVLGDLQERGFRLTDLIAVVPQVWWSHLSRTVAVPTLAGASQAIVQRRSDRLDIGYRGAIVTWMAAIALNGLFVKNASVTLTPLLLILLVKARRTNREVSNREAAVEHHRQQLAKYRRLAMFGVPYFFVVMGGAKVWSTFVSYPLPLELPAYAIALAYGQFRARRLQRELDGLA